MRCYQEQIDYELEDLGDEEWLTGCPCCGLPNCGHVSQEDRAIIDKELDEETNQGRELMFEELKEIVTSADSMSDKFKGLLRLNDKDIELFKESWSEITKTPELMPQAKEMMEFMWVKLKDNTWDEYKGNLWKEVLDS